MSMSDTERAERLSRELEAAFRNRADLYRLMFEELAAEVGRDVGRNQQECEQEHLSRFYGRRPRGARPGA